MNTMESRSKQRWETRSGTQSSGHAGTADRRPSYARLAAKSSDEFNLKSYLDQHKSIIDSAVEGYLGQACRIPALLHQAMCYGALEGGKRFRPILTLAVGELFGARTSALLPFASAIEFIHCYSLIHDDLPALDNDDFRRGKPSCHKRFGEATALLAGDALLTEAFFIMSEPRLKRSLGAGRMAQLVREISAAAGARGMVAGQSLELEIDKKRLTPADLEQIDGLKTGALITTAARAGAIIGGAAPKDLERITRYAQALGLAFQITDDMLDAHELSAHNGAGNDKAAVNYLSVAGSAQAGDRVKGLLRRCLKAIQVYGAAAAPLREIAQHMVARTE